MRAVLVVNMQNDHVDGAWPVPGADKLIKPINQLLAAFPLCVANKKWHPQDHLSFAANHKGKKVGDTVKINRQHWQLKPTHCVAGTEGSDFAKGLQSWRFETVFRTCTHAGFEDGGAFSDRNNENSTALDAYLLGRGVNHLYICGVPFETAIRDTAVNAGHCIRHVYVVKDAVAGWNKAAAKDVWADLDPWKVREVTVAQALKDVG